MSQIVDRHDGVLRPGIRTFKPRRSRMSERQRSALRDNGRWLLELADGELDLGATWGVGVPVILEIGFGTGGATADLAEDDPHTGILAVDIHTPGVGNLVDLVARRGLTNVRVMEADALAVLDTMIGSGSLTGVRSYFPDPWPKARHHKRRLVQQPILDLVRSRLLPGGTWHLATDWQEYATSMEQLFAADCGWRGGVVDRPTWRPETNYERRAVAEGRQITDLVFHTVPPAGSIGS